jgi:hypothetical protein
MKRYILSCLVPLLLLAGCGGTDPVPYECIAWANQYYITHPVETLNHTAGSWMFRGAKDIGGALRVGFIVPAPLHADKERRQANLQLVCPGKSEDIWRILPEENHYYIDVWTQNLKFRDSFECR